MNSITEVKVVNNVHGNYLEVPTDRGDAIARRLEKNQVRFWAEHWSIQINGAPAITTVHLAFEENPDRVQAILDNQ